MGSRDILGPPGNTVGAGPTGGAENGGDHPGRAAQFNGASV